MKRLLSVVTAVFLIGIAFNANASNQFTDQEKQFLSIAFCETALEYYDSISGDNGFMEDMYASLASLVLQQFAMELWDKPRSHPLNRELSRVTRLFRRDPIGGAAESRRLCEFYSGKTYDEYVESISGGS